MWLILQVRVSTFFGFCLQQINDFRSYRRPLPNRQVPAVQILGDDVQSRALKLSVQVQKAWLHSDVLAGF